MSLQVENGIKILKYAIENKKTLKETSEILNFHPDYFSSVKKRIKGFLEKNTITKKEYDYFISLHNEYLSKRDEIVHELSIKTAAKSKEKINKDLSDSDEYDKRSFYEVVRDDNDKIVKYTYFFYVRDSDPITGELTREQMETIYNHYPYVTSATCSSYFPYLTFTTFKKILRLFNITKEKLFPQHLLEEKSETEVAELALKAKEHATYKKFVDQKPQFVEKSLRDVQKELIELTEKRNWFQDSFKEIIKDLKINKINISYKKIDNDNALFIYLSDHHIGACTKNAQFSKEYTKEVYYDRLKQILQEVKNQKELYKRFDKVYVINLGDAMDGYNGETTRMGHHLPQNLNNKEQFKVYIESMIFFFEELHKLDMSNGINFVSVGTDNHSGDFGYNANMSLKYIFDIKFPDLNFRLFEKNIEHFEYGVNTFIATHGKDAHDMKRNFPMVINAVTENYFINYCKLNGIENKNVIVVKGDLHSYNSQTGKNIIYKNIPSLFGGSGWIDANYGYTQPAFVFQIVNKKTPKIIEGYLELE